MGSVLAIPSWVDIADLGITTSIGMMVAKAAQQYGLIITDRGGSGVTLGVEASVSAVGVGTYDYGINLDLDRILSAVQRAMIDPGDYASSEQMVLDRSIPTATTRTTSLMAT